MPEHLTELTADQKQMYRSICIEDAYQQLKSQMPRTANRIIERAFVGGGPDLNATINHLEYLVEHGIRIPYAYTLLTQLRDKREVEV